MLTSALFRKITLVSYCLLVVWLVIWHGSIGTSHLPSYLNIPLWLLPILLPAKGIFQGIPYTHAWMNFILMFYLMHGITTWYAMPDEAVYAAIEVMLTSVLFVGCSFYARLRGKELGLKIKKLKVEMAEEKALFDTNSKEGNHE